MDHDLYLKALRGADEALDSALVVVRVEYDSGRLTGLEAAAERINLYQGHLALLQRLRRDLLGET